jgi:hypothetical protein
MQEILVEDLASLYWRKIQAARAQADARLGELAEWEQGREKRALHAQTDDGEISDTEVIVSGYRGSSDCWKKFDVTDELLDSLRDRAERRAWSEGVKEIFESLYGMAPTRRGKWMMQRFERFAQGEGAHAAEPAACEELLKWIAEGKQDVVKERELFERRGQNPSAGGCARRGLEGSLETGLRGARIGYIHCQLLGKMR